MTREATTFRLPEDQVAALKELSRGLGMSPRALVERLTETFDVTWRRYEHLLGVGQPMLVVILPASRGAGFILGAGVAPGEMSWRR